MTSVEEEARRAAASTISLWWRGIYSRRMFDRLKHALILAEKAMVHDVIHHVVPSEAALLSDPTIRPVLRFRFGGSDGEFPPVVLFKVFLATKKGDAANTTLVYMNGRKMIRPASEAAKDAYRLMGRRKFIEQMVQDEVQRAFVGNIDEDCIVTLQDYLEYTNIVDNQPASLGGRGNDWRVLHTSDAKQQGLLYDLSNYFRGEAASHALQQRIPNINKNGDSPLKMKKTEKLAKLRALEATRKLYHDTTTSMRGGGGMQGVRKKQQHLHKLRSLYGLQTSQSGRSSVPAVEEEDFEFDIRVTTPGPPNPQVASSHPPEDLDVDIDENLDELADGLYEWTQTLSLSNDFN
eukprot:m.65619 g.65619  ORF g.65619 m.65619 type:complete len:349 (+) comp11748_c0_seq2:190-1236(+)